MHCVPLCVDSVSRRKQRPLDNKPIEKGRIRDTVPCTYGVDSDCSLVPSRLCEPRAKEKNNDKELLILRVMASLDIGNVAMEVTRSRAEITTWFH